MVQTLFGGISILLKHRVVCDICPFRQNKLKFSKCSTASLLLISSEDNLENATYSDALKTRPEEGMKIWGRRASTSNVSGIICPLPLTSLVGIGSTYLPKHEGGGAHFGPPISTALKDRWVQHTMGNASVLHCEENYFKIVAVSRFQNYFAKIQKGRTSFVLNFKMFILDFRQFKKKILKFKKKILKFRKKSKRFLNFRITFLKDF